MRFSPLLGASCALFLSSQTVHSAPPEEVVVALLDIADLVTEMTLIKHPYQAGYRAQRGIEF